MSAFAKSLRNQSITLGRHGNNVGGPLTSRRATGSMASSRVSDSWRYGGGDRGVDAAPAASQTSRPSTCNSIVEMLITKKK